MFYKNNEKYLVKRTGTEYEHMGACIVNLRIKYNNNNNRKEKFGWKLKLICF